ncbi:MAG: DUF748 domain-containing protein [Candidatus Omnitrophota bacterium]|jgi:hypothetical protein
MKLWKNTLIVILIFLTLLFSAIYIWVKVKGREFMTERLERALNKKVNIGYLGLTMPLALEIREIEIEGLANIDYIYISPHLFGLLSGKIILNKVMVLRPEINWVVGLPTNLTVKKESEDAEIDEVLAQTREILGSPSLGFKQFPRIIIKYLRIEEASVNFTDKAVSETGVKLSLEEILVDVNNLYLFPKSAVTNFQLTAKIPWQEDSGKGIVYASGWVNLYRKEMQARLEIEDIDGISLYPYYSKWVDLENSRIERVRLNFFSDIQGMNNELIAQCRLELTDIKFKPRPPEQPEHKAEKIATAILGLFRALNQGRVVLNFTIKTKMDKPEFSIDNISQAVEETISRAINSEKIKIEDIAILPAKFFKGMTKGTTEATKAIINGALSVGKSLLDVLKTEDEPRLNSEQDKLFAE